MQTFRKKTHTKKGEQPQTDDNRAELVKKDFTLEIEKTKIYSKKRSEQKPSGSHPNAKKV